MHEANRFLYCLMSYWFDIRNNVRNYASRKIHYALKFPHPISYIEIMTKTEKEIAFLRGFSVEPDWTQRFTDVFDETIEIKDIETLTYISAGAGNHAIEMDEKLGDDVAIFPVCETEEIQKVATVKAEATKSELDFSTKYPLVESDFVLADASLVQLKDLEGFLKKAVHLSSDRVALFLPTAGSFGEIFSYLWEVLAEMNLLKDGNEIEKLIQNIPTVSAVEEMLKALDIEKIETTTKNEVFEFDNGKEFIESPLILFFFVPNWLNFLDEKKTSDVLEKLAIKIDEDCEELTFHFTVKATIIGGKRK